MIICELGVAQNACQSAKHVPSGVSRLPVTALGRMLVNKAMSPYVHLNGMQAGSLLGRSVLLSHRLTSTNVCPYRTMYEIEVELMPDPDYLDNHGPELLPDTHLDAHMRLVAVSWLVEVACEYNLHQETLFLATALLDRFLSKAKVPAVLQVLHVLNVCCP